MDCVARFSKKKFPTSNFSKIHPVEAELISADRQTDKETR
jgi:hypothetical protein